MLSESAEMPEEVDMVPVFMVVTQGWPMQFEMDEDFNYEPQADESIAVRAEAAGKSGAEYAYDLMMEDDGKGFIYLLTIAQLYRWQSRFSRRFATGG